jgi:hypothetical protein
MEQRAVIKFYVKLKKNSNIEMLNIAYGEECFITRH